MAQRSTLSQELEAKMQAAVNAAEDNGAFDSSSDSSPEPVSSPTDAPDSTVDVASSTDTTTTPDAATTATAAPVDPKTQADVDELAAELGLKPRADGRENRIPYSKVKVISENARKKEAAIWEGKLSEHTAKLAEYEQERTSFAQVERMMLENPEEFISRLSQINPVYANLRGSKPNAPANTVAEEPQPDLQFNDGSLGFSAAAMRKLVDYRDQQAEKRFTERFGPIERDYKAQQVLERTMPKVQAQIAEARTWPLFNEHEAEVVKILQSNPNLSLERAYQHVVLPKLKADKTKMETDIRAKIMAEINSKPHSTSASPTTPVSRNDEPKSLDDQMMDALRAKGLV